MAKEKIIETLKKLSGLFGSARILAEAVQQHGLFNGKVFYADPNEYDFEDAPEGWVLEKLDSPTAFATAAHGWADPEFGAYLSGDQWTCSVGFGRHWVQITFHIKTGAVISLVPDDIPSSRCWGTDDPARRVDFVNAYLGSGRY